MALRLNTLLCSVLVVTALYSINIRVLGNPMLSAFIESLRSVVRAPERLQVG